MGDDSQKLDEAVRLLHDVRVQVEGIKTRLDEHVKHQDERTRNRDASQAAITGRVDVLEKFRWTALGAAAAAGGLAGKLAGFL